MSGRTASTQRVKQQCKKRCGMMIECEMCNGLDVMKIKPKVKQEKIQNRGLESKYRKVNEDLAKFNSFLWGIFSCNFHIPNVTFMLLFVAIPNFFLLLQLLKLHTKPCSKTSQAKHKFASKQVGENNHARQLSQQNNRKGCQRESSSLFVHYTWDKSDRVDSWSVGSVICQMRKIVSELKISKA